jgi:hypothetical protein
MDVFAAVSRVEAVLPVLAKGWGYPTVQHQIYNEDIPLLLQYVRYHASTLEEGSMVADEPILVANGHNGQIRLYDNYLVITRKGSTGFLSHGFSGEKTILLSSITGVQFQRPSGLVSGYLQLSIMGGQEAKSGAFAAAKDENAVMWRGQHRDDFEALYPALMERLRARQT